MSKCTKSPWYRFSSHKWEFSTNDEHRNLARKSQDSIDILFMGTLEAREVRICINCGRTEQRDVYGGNYIPDDWTLKCYKKLNG